MNDNWCEIFRAGTYKDKEGKVITYSENDLETIIKNFNEAENPTIPICVGHPKDNSPAFGWIENLKRKANKLYASFKEVDQNFQECVNNGYYKNRSVSLYPDLKLRHVAFLGAMPPRVKGMEEFKFCEEPSSTYDFSDLDEFKFDHISGIFSRIRDLLIEHFGLDSANKIIDKYEIENLKKIENKTPKEPAAFSDKDEIKTHKEILMDKISPPPSNMPQNADFAEFEKRASEKEAILQSQIDKLNTKNRRSEFEQFAENLLVNGNITPAVRPFVLDFMEVCHNQNSYDFSEGEEKSVLIRFKNFLSGLKSVNFAEVLTKKNSGETIDFTDEVKVKDAISELINSEAKKGNVISAQSALTKLEKGGKC